MESITVYIGRDNIEAFDLYQDLNTSALVPEDTVTSATLRFGGWCIDTESDPELIQLTNSATRLEFKAGLIDDLAEGRYRGMLTLFDDLSDGGEAWASITVRVVSWPICFAGAGV